MSGSAVSPRIGIYGSDQAAGRRKPGFVLWTAGCAAAIAEAGGTPVAGAWPDPESYGDDLLYDLDGVVLLGAEGQGGLTAVEEWLCRWCREHHLPLLAVDRGLHALNTAFGGTLHLDLARELPQALQHQRLPEPGDRHATAVLSGTHLARFYEDQDEIVVTSEHRQAVSRVARGFRVSGRALDGVIEAIEADSDVWFALGVQWHPGCVDASGLDIQLFRGFVEACVSARRPSRATGRRAAA